VCQAAARRNQMKAEEEILLGNGDGGAAAAANKCQSMSDFGDGKAVLVMDSTGRVGNHLFAYTSLVATKIKLGLHAFQAQHSRDILAPYFANLTMPVAEQRLCGFETLFQKYKTVRYAKRMERLRQKVDEYLGYHVDLNVTKTGQLEITQDLIDKGVPADRLVHQDDFKDVIDYEFDRSHFPWELFGGTLPDLEEKAATATARGRAFISENVPTDEAYRTEPGVEEVMKAELKLRPELIASGSVTLARIADEFQAVLKARHEMKAAAANKKKAAKGNTTKKAKKFKRKELTFVGIHSRRTDYTALMLEKGGKELTPNYFVNAMDMYRAHYKNPVFLYVSDDLEWGKRHLLPHAKRTTQDLFFVGDGLPRNVDSVGHDLAVMSLCNHTIISRGTFSYWMGFLAGGNVVRPDHFPEFRKYGEMYHTQLNKDPLKEPPKNRLLLSPPFI